MAYQHSDPRSLPLPALPSPSLASPPPAIVVQPFHSHPPSPHQPQLSTYAPSSHPRGLASPEYAPQQTFARRSPAEEEKDAYFARSASVDSYGSYSHDEHWADVHAPGAAPLAVGGKPAPILLPPPRAAFVTEPGSPRSPMSLKQAMAFGDVGSVLDEKVGGRGAADMRKSGLDWARFSRMVKESEAEKESEWLRRKQGSAKKWWIIGLAGSAAIIIAIVIALVVHFKNPSSSSDTTPSVSQLEGRNSTSASSSPSTSASVLPHSGVVPVAAGASTSATTSGAVTATSTWREEAEDDMVIASSSVAQQAALDLDTTTTTRPLARTTAATTSTTISPSAMTTTRAAARSSTSTTTTSTTATSSSSRSATSAAAASSTRADVDRRSKRWLRFGQDGKPERGGRQAWNAVEFVHLPIGDARRKRDVAGGAH